MPEDELSELDIRILALAAIIMRDEAPDVPNHDWLGDSLFRALQTYAAIRQGEPEADILAACEAIGRMKAQTYAAMADVA